MPGAHRRRRSAAPPPLPPAAPPPHPWQVIRPYKKAHINRATDVELVLLKAYLCRIAALEDLSGLNHRRWERYLQGAGLDAAADDAAAGGGGSGGAPWDEGPSGSGSGGQ
jgi:hypothetical protein